ncbi:MULTISPECIES: ceramidase domain-containing protein [unclassified Aureimonas]|uniref:ceramidase domain-containing protein n=1 Tax=unclassified Aureimonas TaxID=2615206 RepID=UPI0006F3457E|nr:MULTISPECIES: ceramidase domain-containing protein [unclassified Aureimonas]KQT64428.1 hypothetical protein ASG62_05565 [Aureimonas sp. Leaf427]KQT81617.1 hypothetical protein ASG54_02845 [Aureimonas sp. Leaf460]
MAWTDPIDAYCERLGPGFWAEPLNAWTNLAFLLAAILAFRLWRRLDRRAHAECRRRDLASLALVVLVGVIGIGSFLFHTFADRWSVLADVVPIGIFIYAYLALALRRFADLARWKALVATLLFAGASVLVETALEPALGGSAAYAPALLALFGLGGWLVATGRRPGRLVLGAGLVFAVSLTLRTLDGPLCASVPIGTHFLWHILNAATLGLLLLAAVRQGPRPVKRRITP